MAAHLTPVLLTCLLLLMVLMVEVKPSLAKGGNGLKKRVETLEKTVKEQNEKIKKQEEKIKVLEECKGKYTYNRSTHIQEKNVVVISESD